MSRFYGMEKRVIKGRATLKSINEYEKETGGGH